MGRHEAIDPHSPSISGLPAVDQARCFRSGCSGRRGRRWRRFPADHDVAVDVAIVGVVVEVDAAVPAADDKVVSDDVPLTDAVGGSGSIQQSSAPVCGAFEAGVAELVVLDDVAAAAGVAEVDGVMRARARCGCARSRSLAQPEQHAVRYLFMTPRGGCDCR